MFSWQGRYDARDVDIRFVTRRLTPEMVLENYARGVFPDGESGVWSYHVALSEAAGGDPAGTP